MLYHFLKFLHEIIHLNDVKHKLINELKINILTNVARVHLTDIKDGKS